MARAFHQLAAGTQEAKVRAALKAGQKPEAGAVTIYLGLEESEVTAVAEVLERLNGKPKHGDPAKAARRPKGGRKGLSTKRVAPVEPKRETFGEGAAGTQKFREAHAAYEKALEEYRALDGQEHATPEPPKVRARKQPPVKAERANAKAAEAEETRTRKANGSRTRLEGFDGSNKATIAKVVKLHQSGQTIKEIAEAFGLPAEHRSWYAVSMVWRREADRLGLDRPRRSKEAK